MKDNKDKLENEHKDNKKRKIEFRGKRVDNGEWVYGLPIYMNYIKEFTEHEWIDELDNNRVKKYQTSAAFQIEGETLGQFTGLYDKNGKDIYEGDVVEDVFDDYTYTVMFDEKRGGWYPFACGDGCGCCEAEVTQPKYCKVVGNIYDNGG